MTSRPPTPLAALAALLLGLLLSSSLVAGCSDDSGSSGSSGSTASSSEAPASSGGTSETCAAVDRLRSDVTAMAQSTGIQQFNGHYETAREDFAQVRSSASAELGPQVDQVEKALQHFGDAIAKLGDDGANGQQLQQLAVAAQQLVTSVQTLASQARC